MILNPSETAELRGDKLVKTKYSTSDLLLWRSGIYAFDDVPFVDMVKKLELYYDITINVHNEKLKQNKFTAKFRQRDGIESVLRTLQKAYPFSFIKDDDKNIGKKSSKAISGLFLTTSPNIFYSYYFKYFYLNALYMRKNIALLIIINHIYTKIVIVL